MLTRMSPWDPGLLDSMSNISMIGDSVVALHQIASGRLRRETFALLRSIGVAAGFASLRRGLRRSIDGVEKARMYYGVPLSEMLLGPSSILGSVVCTRKLANLVRTQRLKITDQERESAARATSNFSEGWLNQQLKQKSTQILCGYEGQSVS
ncbi:hypothetical protein SDJN02_01766, partial [Cucurbita argyrosperma subsp. argyrosperma]